MIAIAEAVDCLWDGDRRSGSGIGQVAGCSEINFVETVGVGVVIDFLLDTVCHGPSSEVIVWNLSEAMLSVAVTYSVHRYRITSVMVLGNSHAIVAFRLLI